MGQIVPITCYSSPRTNYCSSSNGPFPRRRSLPSRIQPWKWILESCFFLICSFAFPQHRRPCVLWGLQEAHVTGGQLHLCLQLTMYQSCLLQLSLYLYLCLDSTYYNQTTNISYKIDPAINVSPDDGWIRSWHCFCCYRVSLSASDYKMSLSVWKHIFL